MKKTSRLKPRSKPKIILPIVTLIFFIFCLSTVSAWEWDNVLKKENNQKLDSKYPVLKIDNAFGFGEGLARMELIDDGNQCLVDCYAIINLTLYHDESIFKDLIFQNKKNENKILNHGVYYEVINNYQEIIPTYKENCVGEGNKTLCSLKRDGEEIQNKTTYEWIKYNGEILKSGNYKIKIKATKDPNEAIDWSFNLIGIKSNKIKEYWAWWDSDWNKKQEIKIQERYNQKDLINYTVRINITYDSNMKTDFSDLRFLDSSESKELGHFIVNKTDSSWAMFDVLVENISIGRNTSIYMYYDNPSALSNSYVGNAYLLGDDFNDGVFNSTKWAGAGSHHENSSNVTIENANGHIRGLNNWSSTEGLLLTFWHSDISGDGYTQSGLSPPGDMNAQQDPGKVGIREYGSGQVYAVTQLGQNNVGTAFGNKKVPKKIQIISNATTMLIATNNGNLTYTGSVTQNNVTAAFFVESNGFRIVIQNVTLQHYVPLEPIINILGVEETYNTSQVLNGTVYSNYTYFTEINNTYKQDNNFTVSIIIDSYLVNQTDINLYNSSGQVNTVSFNIQDSNYISPHILSNQGFNITENSKVTGGNSDIVFNSLITGEAYLSNKSLGSLIKTGNYSTYYSNLPNCQEVNYNDPYYLINDKTDYYFCVKTSNGDYKTVQILNGILSNITLKVINTTLSYNFTNLGNLNKYYYNATIYTTSGNFSNLISRTINFDNVIPVVNITEPTGIIQSSNPSSTNVSLKYTISDTSPASNCWYYTSDNSTNTTINNCQNTSIVFTSGGIKNVYLYVNDSAGNIGFDSNNFEITVVQYTNITYDTSYQSFILSYDFNETIYDNIIANLIYDNISYVAKVTGGDNKILTANIDIPSVNEISNKSFYWSIYEINSTGVYNTIGTINNQTVVPTNISYCPANNNGIFAVNYSVHNETNKTILPMNNISINFKANLEWYLGSGTVKKNNSFDLSGNNTYNFCINTNQTFKTNSYLTIEAGGFGRRNIYLNSKNYSNITTNQDLYLLSNGQSSNIIIETKDLGNTPEDDIYVEIWRKYDEEGSYKMVESQKTDTFGQFVAKLVENDVYYRFKFYNLTNHLEKDSDDITIACRSSFCVLPFIIQEEVNPFVRYDSIDNYESSLEFNNNTNNYLYSWNDQTGSNPKHRLEVTRYLLNGTTIVCNITSTDLIGSLSCSVGNSKASYTANAYREASPEVRKLSLSTTVGDDSNIFGFEGIVWSFVLTMTFIAIGVFNPVVGIVLYLVGFIFLSFFDIIYVNPAIIIAEIVIGVLFIWAFRR